MVSNKKMHLKTADIMEFKETYDHFQNYFDEYFKETDKYESYQTFRILFNNYSHQILGSRLWIDHAYWEMLKSVKELALASQDHNTLEIKDGLVRVAYHGENEPKEIMLHKGNVLINHWKLVAGIKSFYILNRMLFDVIAQIVILAYFKKGGEIGTLYSSSYNDVFKTDSKNVGGIRKLDPTFLDKLEKINEKYKSEIRAIRDDFVHHYRDINVYIKFQRLDFEDLICEYQIVKPKMQLLRTADYKEKGDLIPIESIDDVFKLSKEVLDQIKRNFPSSKKKELLGEV